MVSPKIELSKKVEELLLKISRQGTSQVREVERACLILMFSANMSNLKVKEISGLSVSKARRWRARWISFEESFKKIESDVSNKYLMRDLEQKIRDCLSDAAREGSPAKFTAEAYCQILGVSLEDPKQSGRPISHWTLDELKMEIELRGIVEKMSRAQLGNFLKQERNKTT
jgi:putative transposase